MLTHSFSNMHRAVTVTRMVILTRMPKTMPAQVIHTEDTTTILAHTPPRPDLLPLMHTRIPILTYPLYLTHTGLRP